VASAANRPHSPSGSTARVRYGYFRIYILLRREGFRINHKRVYRLYRAEGLSMRHKRPRRHLTAAHPDPACGRGT